MISDVITRNLREIGIIRQRDNSAFELDEYGEAVKLPTNEEVMFAHIQSPTPSDLESLPGGENSVEAIVAYSTERFRKKDLLIADGQEYAVQSTREFRDNGVLAYRAVALWKSERKVEQNEPN